MTCRTGKVSYPSPQRATYEAQHISRRPGRLKRGAVRSTRLTHYRCPFCKQWHIGHERLDDWRAA